MNTVDIIDQWLIDNGYDGLYTDGECACEIGDLVLYCGDGFQNCKPGYKTECDCGDHNFHITKDKPKQSWWAREREKFFKRIKGKGKNQ